MEMNLNITFAAAPEFVAALNSVAAAFSAAAAFHRVDTQVAAKPTKAKLAPVEKETVSVAPAADQPLEPLVVDMSVVVDATSPAATTSAHATPLTVDEVKTLAALKAKEVGAAVVKGIIADTGAATISEITDPLVLASLAANLEAL